MYDTKFKKEKELQADILLQKEDHTNADKEFHITASTVLNLAKRATEIIKSSEPEEKRQFLGYLLQNRQLNGRNLDFTLRNPFDLIAKYSSYPTMQSILEIVRTHFAPRQARGGGQKSEKSACIERSRNEPQF